MLPLIMWLTSSAITRPRTTIGIGALVVLALAPGVLWLELRTDGHALVPPDAVGVAIDREVRTDFGVEDPAIILIESHRDDGIFNSATLTLVATISQRLEGALRPGGSTDVGLTSVMSLATERGDRYPPHQPGDPPGLKPPLRFLDPVPTTPEELERLRGDLEALEIFDGTLVASDDQSTAIFVGLEADRDRVEIYRWLQQEFASLSTAENTVHVIGAPIAEALLGLHILQDLGLPDAWIGMPATAAGATPTGAFDRARTFLGEHIGMVPLALVILSLVFALAFRSVAGVALPLTEVGCCLAFVFGGMGYLGVPVYLTIAVLPVILTAIGVADEVHVLAEFRRQRAAAANDSARVIVERSMAQVTAPIVRTSITSAAAFLSFSLSPLVPVQAFGVAAAVGIVFCMVFSLTVIPAALVLWNPSFGARPSKIAHLVGSIGERSARSPAFALVLLAGLGVAIGFGARRVEVQDSWIAGFAPTSEFRRGTETFNAGFFGMHQLFLAVSSDPIEVEGQVVGADFDLNTCALPGGAITVLMQRLVGCSLEFERDVEPGTITEAAGRRVWRTPIETAARHGDEVIVTWNRRHGSPRFLWRLGEEEPARFRIESQAMLRPPVLHVLRRLQNDLESQVDLEVGGTLGPPDYVETTRFIIKARDPEARRVPDNGREIQRLWTNCRWIRGEERLREVVDDRRDAGLITVFLRDANYRDTSQLIERVRDFESEHLEPEGLALALGGDVAVSQTLIEAIVSTQTRSLLVSLLIILVVASLLQRSLAWGLFCVLPSSLAIGLNYAVMGWLGIPLGVATSLFACMVLGIGVDYAIHFAERYRRSTESSAATRARTALAECGPAITIDAIAVGASFGVLLISQVPANARLGGLTALGLVSCFVATVVIGPALLGLGKTRATEDAR